MITELYNILIKKEKPDFDRLVNQAVESPDILAAVLEGIGSGPANIKYRALKIAGLISEIHPELLYDKFSFFATLTKDGNSIKKWGAINIIGNLAKIDCDCKFENIFGEFFEPVMGPFMITAANTITAGGKIARANPKLQERIAVEILKVKDASCATDECKNIAIGHAIDAFDKFFPFTNNKDEIVDFVSKNTCNSRNATRKKAEKFLKKYGIL